MPAEPYILTASTPASDHAADPDEAGLSSLREEDVKADPAADSKVVRPPSSPPAAPAAPCDTLSALSASAPAEAATKEFRCLRCGHCWDRHYTAPTDPAYSPRACPSCHSAYWEAAPKLAHARRPSATPEADHRARQREMKVSRQRTRLTRMLYAIGAEAALAVVRVHPPIAALLAAETKLTPPHLDAAPPAEPQRVIIEVRQPAPEPLRYPWQSASQDSASPGSAVTSSLIPPPPSVTTLPAFATASMAAPSPEEVIARRTPEPA